MKPERVSDRAVLAAIAEHGPSTRADLADYCAANYIDGDAYGGVGRALARLCASGHVIARPHVYALPLGTEETP